MVQGVIEAKQGLFEGFRLQQRLPQKRQKARVLGSIAKAGFGDGDSVQAVALFMKQADQGAPAAPVLKINPKTLAVGQLRIPGRAATPIAVAEAQPSLDAIGLEVEEGP